MLYWQHGGSYIVFGVKKALDIHCYVLIFNEAHKSEIFTVLGN